MNKLGKRIAAGALSAILVFSVCSETGMFLQQEGSQTVLAAEGDAIASISGITPLYDGAEVTFDSASGWDEKSETQLALTTEQALKKGASVKMNFLIPKDKAEFSGYIKFKAVARLGSDWTWTESDQSGSKTLALTRDDFTETADGAYMSAPVTFTFSGDNITADKLASFTIVLAGTECDFSGITYVENVELIDGTATTGGNEETHEKLVYEKADAKDIDIDFSALDAEDWGATMPMISYDESISDVSVTENAIVRAKFTIDEEMYQSLVSGALKVQSVMKTQDGWEWNQAAKMPELTQESVTADGSSYSLSAEFAYSGVKEGVLKGIYFRFAGVGPKGKVTVSDVKVSNVEKGEAPLPEADPAVVDDFESAQLGTDGGWEQESGWQYANGLTRKVVSYAGSQMLELGLDYTGCGGYTWSEAKIKKNFAEGMDVSAYNRLTFTLIAPKEFSGFKTKVFGKNSDSEEVIIEKEGVIETTDLGDGTVKADVIVSFSPNAEKLTDLTLGIVGVSTTFVGNVYLDDIRLSQYNAAADFVDITSVPQAGTVADTSKMPATVTLSDADATTETKALYAYLTGLSESDEVLFGHQNDTHKHVTGRSGVYSDTKDVTGSISGIVGIDSLSLTGAELGMDNVDDAIAETVKISKEAAAEGAILTLSTHMPNMSDSKIKATPDASRPYDFSACDFSESKNLSNNCSKEVLPGGKYNAQFCAYLDILADYANGLGDIPVLFRPFHENTGGWFWWGSATTDIETYNALFRYAHDYLTEEKGVHNFIYVYSPGGPIETESAYEKRYPGDEYVDIVAFDYYDDYNTYPAAYSDDFMKGLAKTCQVVKSFGDKHGKLAAISETGVRVQKADGSDNEGILVKDNPIKGQNWYSKVNAIAKENGMPYFLVWANFSDTNFYVPYKYNDTKGQELINEFIDFYNESSTIFANGTNFYGNVDSNAVANGNTNQNPGGYFTNVFSKDALVGAQSLYAYVKNANKVQFILANGENKVTLDAAVTGKSQSSRAAKGNIYLAANSGVKAYKADVTETDLAALGKTDVGTITLVADGKTLSTLSFVSFGQEKATLPANVIENFELYYGDDDYLNGTFTENSAAGCSSAFRLTDEKSGGTYGGAFDYTLKSSGPEVWTGRQKGLSVNDYSAYNALTMWVKPDGKGQKLVIQLVSNGEDFEAHLTDFVATSDAKYVTIPFDKLKGKNGGTFDPSNVTKFAVWCNSVDYVNGVDLSSTIVFDDIQCIKLTDKELEEAKSNPYYDKGYIVTDTSYVKDPPSGNGDNGQNPGNGNGSGTVTTPSVTPTATPTTTAPAAGNTAAAKTKTGDTTPIVLWSIVAVISGSVAVVLIRRKKLPFSNRKIK